MSFSELALAFQNAPYFLSLFTICFFIYIFSRIVDRQAPPDLKAAAELFATGEYDGTWIQQCNDIFDRIYGKNHFSRKCILRSILLSIASVILFTIIFTVLLRLFNAESLDFRIWGEQDLSSVLLTGLIVNLFADYLSLLETRILLRAFARIRSKVLHVLLLIFDVILSGFIFWICINAVSLMKGAEVVSWVELAALYTPFSIFFLSTYSTSFLAWVYGIGGTVSKILIKSGISKSDEAVNRPFTLIGFWSAIIIFIFGVFLAPAFASVEGSKGTVLDHKLCAWFEKEACSNLARLTEDQEQALEFQSQACRSGEIKECQLAGQKYIEKDRDAALELWELACSREEKISCYLLAGNTHNWEFFGKQNFEASLQLYKRACDLGYSPGCIHLALMYRAGLGTQKNKIASNQILSDMCSFPYVIGRSDVGEKYVPRACQILAADYVTELPDDQKPFVVVSTELKMGRSVDPESYSSAAVALAYAKLACLEFDYCQPYIRLKEKLQDPFSLSDKFNLFYEICENGGDNSCIELALYLLENPELKTEDNIQYLTMLDNYCEEKFFEIACYYAGKKYSAIKDFSNAYKFYKLGCESDSARACLELALLYRYGFGVEQQTSSEKKYLEKTCSMRMGWACRQLEYFHNNSTSFSDDWNFVLSQYEAGCEDGNGYYCSQVIDVNEYHGNDNFVDQKLKFYSKGCEQDDYFSCAALGELYEFGEGVQVSFSKAIKFYELSCDNETGFACYRYVKLTQKMEDIDLSLEDELKYYSKSCSLNYEPACEFMEKYQAE